MKVKYVFPLEQPIKFEDHWPVPLLGGVAKMVEIDGLITAIEFEKSGCPVELAFRIIETPDEISKATIHGNDGFSAEVRDHLERAFDYLQCYFTISFKLDEIQITHEAEGPEERERIAIPSFTMAAKEKTPLDMGYDMLTRALMAAGESEGPAFHASLAQSARDAWASRKYIDAFRFSFLLIEAAYGDGKFKSKALQGAFAAQPRLVEIIDRVVADWSPPSPPSRSSTDDLMSSFPTALKVMVHLIQRRGHYFHGNLKSDHAWSPKKQDEAQSLAWLSLQVAQGIANEAAALMFDPKFAARHFTEAGQMGAHVVMEIEYLFRIPEEDFLRRHVARFRMPGTKATTTMAMEAATNAISHFRELTPVGRLHSVKAVWEGVVIFSLRFDIEADGQVVDS